MIHQIIIFSVLVVSSQLHSAAATACVDDFIQNKFQNFDIPLDSQMDSYRSTASNFYVQGKFQLRDLSVTQVSKQVSLESMWSKLESFLERPRFDVYFLYSTKVLVIGKHTTSGTILETTPFSGQGFFNATIEVTRTIHSSVYIQSTLSKYLEAQEIVFHSMSDTRKYISALHLENISNNAVFNEHQEYLDDLLYGIGLSLKEKIHQQVQSRFETFWQQQLSETNLADICLTI